MSDLVERLHGWSEYGMVEPKALMAEAAKRIEALEAENDKQRREIAELQTFLRGHQHNIGQLLKGREGPLI